MEILAKRYTHTPSGWCEQPNTVPPRLAIREARSKQPPGRHLNIEKNNIIHD